MKFSIWVCVYHCPLQTELLFRSHRTPEVILLLALRTSFLILLVPMRWSLGRLLDRNQLTLWQEPIRFFTVMDRSGERAPFLRVLFVVNFQSVHLVSVAVLPYRWCFRRPSLPTAIVLELKWEIIIMSWQFTAGWYLSTRLLECRRIRAEVSWKVLFLNLDCWNALSGI